MATSFPAEIAIRAGTLPDDIERCADIWVRALASRDGTVDEVAMAQRVRSAFGHPLVRFAIATSPRSGFALVESGRSEPTEAYLHYLAVDPDGIGEGVGRALLADSIAHARQGGFTTLTLEVRASNTRAIRMYAHAGFVAFGEPLAHPLAHYPIQSYRRALDSAP